MNIKSIFIGALIGFGIAYFIGTGVLKKTVDSEKSKLIDDIFIKYGQDKNFDASRIELSKYSIDKLKGILNGSIN
jgi:hypothetical protein